MVDPGFEPGTWGLNPDMRKRLRNALACESITGKQCLPETLLPLWSQLRLGFTDSVPGTMMLLHGILGAAGSCLCVVFFLMVFVCWDGGGDWGECSRTLGRTCLRFLGYTASQRTQLVL